MSTISIPTHNDSNNEQILQRQQSQPLQVTTPIHTYTHQPTTMNPIPTYIHQYHPVTVSHPPIPTIYYQPTAYYIAHQHHIHQHQQQLTPPSTTLQSPYHHHHHNTATHPQYYITANPTQLHASSSPQLPPNTTAQSTPIPQQQYHSNTQQPQPLDRTASYGIIDTYKYNNTVPHNTNITNNNNNNNNNNGNTTPIDDNTVINNNGSDSPTEGSRPNRGYWTSEEDQRLEQAVAMFSSRSWKKIAGHAFNGEKTDVQCLHRWQKVLRPGLIKGPWSTTEDQQLIQLVEQYGIKKWSLIASQLTGRLGKQCRERWYNHLKPDIKKEAFTPAEDACIIAAHAELGNQWAKIAQRLNGRTDNAIKNRWNSTLCRIVNEAGFTLNNAYQNSNIYNNNSNNNSITQSPNNSNNNSTNVNINTKDNTTNDTSSAAPQSSETTPTNSIGNSSTQPNTPNNNNSNNNTDNQNTSSNTVVDNRTLFSTLPTSYPQYEHIGDNQRTTPTKRRFFLGKQMPKLKAEDAQNILSVVNNQYINVLQPQNNTVTKQEHPTTITTQPQQPTSIVQQIVTMKGSSNNQQDQPLIIKKSKNDNDTSKTTK